MKPRHVLSILALAFAGCADAQDGETENLLDTIAGIDLNDPQTPLAPEVRAQLPDRLVAETFIEIFYHRNELVKGFATWVHPEYIQHDPNSPTGRDPTIAVLAAHMAANPGMSHDVKRVVVGEQGADGTLVAVHYHFKRAPADSGSAVVDIFRIKDGYLTEHWDVIQPLPEGPSASGNSMFDSKPPAPSAEPAEACTTSIEQIAEGFSSLFYDQGKVREAYETYVHENYVQHNPGAQNGRAAAIAFLEPIYQRNPQHRMTRYRTIIEAPYIAVHLHGQSSADDPGAAAVDILRVEDCRIVEHWDVTQAVPTAALNDNTMF